MKTSVFVFRLCFAKRKEAAQALCLALASWLSLLPCKRSPKSQAHSCGTQMVPWHAQTMKSSLQYVFLIEQFHTLLLSHSINMLRHSCHGHAMVWDSWPSQQVVCMPDEPNHPSSIVRPRIWTAVRFFNNQDFDHCSTEFKRFVPWSFTCFLRNSARSLLAQSPGKSWCLRRHILLHMHKMNNDSWV